MVNQNVNQNKMKQTAAIMILVWAAIFALFISKLSEQKVIEPAEEHKFTFVNPQGLGKRYNYGTR
jgi:hypothetical protein